MTTHQDLLDSRDVVGVAGRSDQSTKCRNARPDAARYHGLINLRRHRDAS